MLEIKARKPQQQKLMCVKYRTPYFAINLVSLEFPGGKGGRCVRLTTLPPSCAVVMKSGNLNFLEPTEPLSACNGTAFLYCAIKKGLSCNVTR